MGLLSLLQSHPALFVGLAVLLLYSVIFHEMAHGWVAYLYGDDTARRHGRLTLNPAPHIDLLGLLMLFVVGFGWAKPVPVDYGRLRNARFAFVIVALAGPFTNFLIAAVAAFCLQFQGIHAYAVLPMLLSILVKINVMLGVFNLIPIPPLDGSKVLMGFLPDDVQQSLGWLERYGFLILVILLFTGLLNPVIASMQNVVYSLISATFGLSR